MAEDYSISDEMIDAILDKCKGSMRGALTLLSTFRASESADISELTDAPTYSQEIMDVCRAFTRDGELPPIAQVMKMNGEELRQALIWYLTKTWVIDGPTEPRLNIWRAYMKQLSPPLTAGTPELLARLGDPACIPFTVLAAYVAEEMRGSTSGS